MYSLPILNRLKMKAMTKLRTPYGAAGMLLLAFLFSALAPMPACANDDSGLDGLVTLLADVEDADFQLDLLKGIRDGLQGRKSVPMPKGWSDVYPKLAKSDKPEVREQAQLLALTFGDKTALAELQKTLLNRQADITARQAALKSLVAIRAPGIDAHLQKLVAETVICRDALRGLAAFDSSDTPAIILKHYAQFDLPARQDAIATLICRPAYAHALLDAVEKNVVPRGDISAFSARQIRNFPDEKLQQRLIEVWGEVRESSQENKALIAAYKQKLTPETIAAADIRNGRALFQKSCHQCHKLFGTGGEIGPELTGSNRANLDYVLENVLTPSAAIAKDYQLKTIFTVDGRLINGIVKHTGDNALTVQTANEVVVVPNDDIDEISTSPLSMMPDGLWAQLSDDEIRDLVKYLASKEQVPLPDDFDAAADASP